jgi:hypothetical protein
MLCVILFLPLSVCSQLQKSQRSGHFLSLFLIFPFLLAYINCVRWVHYDVFIHEYNTLWPYYPYYPLCPLSSWSLSSSQIVPLLLSCRFIFNLFDFWLISWFSETGSRNGAQAGVELMSPWHQPPKSWDHSASRLSCWDEVLLTFFAQAGLQLRSFCLQLLRAGITDMHHHSRLGSSFSLYLL